MRVYLYQGKKELCRLHLEGRFQHLLLCLLFLQRLQELCNENLSHTAKEFILISQIADFKDNILGQGP